MKSKTKRLLQVLAASVCGMCMVTAVACDTDKPGPGPGPGPGPDDPVNEYLQESEV